jgi:hypothetical protein
MAKRINLTAHTDKIIFSYMVKLEPLTKIGKRYGVSEKTISRFLKKNGVQPSRGKIKVRCNACGKTIERPKHRIKKYQDQYCSDDCRMAGFKLLRNKQTFRNSTLIARYKISEVFDLKEHHIIYHLDNNTSNNQFWNLLVFEDFSALIQYVHGSKGSSRPIFDGKDYSKNNA